MANDVPLVDFHVTTKCFYMNGQYIFVMEKIVIP